MDLSHPEGFSINDGIPSHPCSLSYITVDDAIQEILKTGPGTLLAKVDIKMPSVYSLYIQPIDAYKAGNGVIWFTLTPSCLLAFIQLHDYF